MTSTEKNFIESNTIRTGRNWSAYKSADGKTLVRYQDGKSIVYNKGISVFSGNKAEALNAYSDILLDRYQKEILSLRKIDTLLRLNIN